MLRTLHGLSLGLALTLAPALKAEPVVPRENTARCPLRTTPERLGSAWDDAVRLERAALEANPGDCGEVVLAVSGGTATLTFRTDDGRTTSRVLHDPSELQPLLEALLVTLPESTSHDAIRPKEPAVAENAVPRAAGSVHGMAGRTPPKSEPSFIHALVVALAGVRLAGPGPLVAPSLDLGAGIELRDWELLAIARWTPVYAVLDHDDTRPAQLASVAAGLAIGRRAPLGRRGELAVGLTLSAASEHEGWHAVSASGARVDEDEDRGQALIGTYAAVIVPVTAKTRFRSLVAADVDATHAGESGIPASGVPALPWWALTLALGVESEVL